MVPTGYSLSGMLSPKIHCLFQLLRIGVLDARISDFWPFKDAVKGLLRNGNIVSKHTVDHTESKPSQNDAPPKHKRKVGTSAR
jgi:hypothetical protein